MMDYWVNHRRKPATIVFISPSLATQLLKKGSVESTKKGYRFSAYPEIKLQAQENTGTENAEYILTLGRTKWRKTIDLVDYNLSKNKKL